MSAELVESLYLMNPWWEGKKAAVPAFKRWMFFKLLEIIRNVEEADSVLLLGMRRTGKTVLVTQLANELSEEFNILYLLGDVLEKLGRGSLLQAVKYFERNLEEPSKKSLIVLDEAQNYCGWADEVKALMDIWRIRVKRSL